MANESFVNFTDVQKTYDGETLVIKDLNLSIARGEFLTLLGPSGSGKTTTLLMLAGFERQTSGTIEIEGRPLSKEPPYIRNFGMVFQDYALFPHMTVAQNIGFPLVVRKRPKAEVSQQVKSIHPPESPDPKTEWARLKREIRTTENVKAQSSGRLTSDHSHHFGETRFRYGPAVVFAGILLLCLSIFVWRVYR